MRQESSERQLGRNRAEATGKLLFQMGRGVVESAVDERYHTVSVNDRITIQCLPWQTDREGDRRQGNRIDRSEGARCAARTEGCPYCGKGRCEADHSASTMMRTWWLGRHRRLGELWAYPDGRMKRPVNRRFFGTPLDPRWIDYATGVGILNGIEVGRSGKR